MNRKKHPYRQFISRTALLLQVVWLLPVLCGAKPVVDTFGITIFSNATIYANDKTQVGISSNFTNNGVFGTVKGTVIHMMGGRWTNGATASFPDELGVTSFSGVGGQLRFISNNTPQMLNANYSVPAKAGASFPNVVISNPFGVYMESDAHVRANLHFENGILWLNTHNLLIGVNDPGSITGYTDKKFVATGNTPAGGYLYRSKVSGASGNVLFPIGPQAGSYSPLSIMYNTARPQDLHVRAFDEIYRNAFFGTKGSIASLQQTWNIGQEDTVSVPTIIALQHNESREGAAFTAHRGNSFVSQYDFIKRNWDTLPPSGITNPGTFTTGTPLNTTYINTRTLSTIGQTTYLTKTADTRTDSLTLGKAALTPTRQPDGTYLVTFMFFVRNEGMYRADSLQVLDSLDKILKPSISFSVVSVKATGTLKANPNFDGVTDNDLLTNGSTLAANTTDTITLVVNVNSGIKEQYYYNTAYVKGVLNGYVNTQYVFNNASVNGPAAPAPGSKPVPTPVILSEARFNMPHGFSPNGDGVNDYLVIDNLGNNKCAIWIFDKNGTYVYKNMNYHNDWDGSNNQNQGGASSRQKIADGTYFYKIVITDAVTGKQETYNGFISVWK